MIIFIVYKYLFIQLYPYIAPENLDNSKITSIISEQYTLKIDDLLTQKEISKYITKKEELVEILKKFCEFFKFLEGGEVISYNLPENMSVFSILNIPSKMKKEEVKQNLELINLKYNRLYKRGFYWILSTLDKETIICVQNSLRILSFDDMKVKYDLKNNNQIWKMMKEQIDKVIYQKEAKNLGVGDTKSNYNNNKHKSSSGNSDVLSWRKGSGVESGGSFDYYEKWPKKNYYNKNNYKRSRFNSDNSIPSNKKKEYKQTSNEKEEIEIDISKLKYPIIIKYKYTFNDIKNYYKSIKDNNILVNSPYGQEKAEVFDELISKNPKTIVSIDELIQASKEIENSEKKEEMNTDIKIPKMNPLSNMNKFGKPLHNDTIEESNKEG